MEEPGTCSFCQTTTKVFKRAGTDFRICDECVFLGQVATGDVPVGTILCKKCQNWRRFTIYHKGGGSMLFEFTCKDDEGEMVYRPVSTATQLTEKTKARIGGIRCETCKQQPPIWLLSYNKYIKDYYNVGPEEPEARDSE